MPLRRRNETPQPRHPTAVPYDRLTASKLQSLTLPVSGEFNTVSITRVGGPASRDGRTRAFRAGAQFVVVWPARGGKVQFLHPWWPPLSHLHRGQCLGVPLGGSRDNAASAICPHVPVPLRSPDPLARGWRCSSPASVLLPLGRPALYRGRYSRLHVFAPQPFWESRRTLENRRPAGCNSLRHPIGPSSAAHQDVTWSPHWRGASP